MRLRGDGPPRPCGFTYTRRVPEGDLDLTVSVIPGAGTVIRVSGDLDLSTVAALERELAGPAEAGERVIVDLSECTFLDSSALRALVVAHRAADAAHGRLELIVTSPIIRRVLEVSALDSLLGLHETLDDAIQESP